MSSGMTRAPSKSIVGPVATAARTQCIFSRSSRCAVCLNLAISKSSIPKAFTTRFPLTVSCRIWLRSPSLVWLFSEERRIFFPSFPTGTMTRGTKMAEPSAIFQFSTTMTTRNTISVKPFWNRSARYSESAMRVRSTSLMVVESKRPVGLL